MECVELIYYLKANLKKPSIDFVWTDDDNTNLFKHIDEFFPNGCLDKDENIASIKKAFKEYFDPVGYILFKLNNRQVRLKVFPYRIEPKDSINLNSIIEILDSNRDLIEYNYKGKDDQILLQEELVSKLNSFAYDIENEEVNFKELIKHAIREALTLSESDIIINKNSQIFIKLFTYKIRVPKNKKNTIENRYNGIDEEKLKTFQEYYFKTEDNKDFFFYVAKIFVETYLVEQQIDNHHYETKVFSYIQSTIIEQLNNEFDNSNDFFIGFSGYIFRIHFKEVFEHIADFILQEVSTLNNYMIDFLKYYSLDIIIIEGDKYKIPSLQADNGQHWNAISILSVSKVYVKVKISVKEITKKYYAMEEQISKLYIGEQTPVEYNDKNIKETQKITDEINRYKHKIDVNSDSLHASKDKNKKAIYKKEIERLKEEVESLQRDKTKLKAKKIHQSVISKFIALERELDSLDRQYKRESKVLENNEKAYQSIKSALVKALVEKKQLI